VIQFCAVQLLSDLTFLKMFITGDTVIHTVSGENGPPQLISHSFTNSQRLLIVFGGDGTYLVVS